MLPYKGLFDDIECPSIALGACRRPYCRFRHGHFQNEAFSEEERTRMDNRWTVILEGLEQAVEQWETGEARTSSIIPNQNFNASVVTSPEVIPTPESSKPNGFIIERDESTIKSAPSISQCDDTAPTTSSDTERDVEAAAQVAENNLRRLFEGSDLNIDEVDNVESPHNRRTSVGRNDHGLKRSSRSRSSNEHHRKDGHKRFKSDAVGSQSQGHLHENAMFQDFPHAYRNDLREIMRNLREMPEAIALTKDYVKRIMKIHNEQRTLASPLNDNKSIRHTDDNSSETDLKVSQNFKRTETLADSHSSSKKCETDSRYNDSRAQHNNRDRFKRHDSSSYKRSRVKKNSSSDGHSESDGCKYDDTRQDQIQQIVPQNLETELDIMIQPLNRSHNTPSELEDMITSRLASAKAAVEAKQACQKLRIRAVPNAAALMKEKDRLKSHEASLKICDDKTKRLHRFNFKEGSHSVLPLSRTKFADTLFAELEKSRPFHLARELTYAVEKNIFDKHKDSYKKYSSAMITSKIQARRGVLKFPEN